MSISNHLFFKSRAVLRAVVLLFFLFLGMGAQAQSAKKFQEKYPNGKVKIKGAYEGDKKTGVWLFYSENGGISRKEKWSSGVFVWSVDYNEKHKKVKGMNSKGDEVIYKGCNCKN